MIALDTRLHRLGSTRPYRVEGRVAGVVGSEIEIRGLRLRVGDAIAVVADGRPRPGEIVALHPEGARALLYAEPEGIGGGDRVVEIPEGHGLPLGRELVGRVVDALGRPLDGGPPVPLVAGSPAGIAPSPLRRRRILEPLPVGVRAIDVFATTGKGQRIGIFGGSGVGKSTLLGMMARGTTAGITVLALIGERGREVREFIEDELGPEGMRRSVVVVATSDQPALLRIRASQLATRIAEWFADEGEDVLLLMDSLTRLAMARREVGLAAGEPPTARGYTPSVFTEMAHLLERAGPRERGTITGFYTVLVEGDDMNDPIADAARSILDGHIVLDRRLAVAGRYPAIDPLASLSRLAPKLVGPDRLELAARARAALAAAEEVRDLVEVGAYVPGSNPAADLGLAAQPHLVEFLSQAPDDLPDFDASWAALAELAPLLAGGDA
ncbi:MAG TPA: FliI/YscN family ATPase [Actinobacteria bacterium]|nr:FliI/YscN family ATPase [Actinomycetota bacterium]